MEIIATDKAPRAIGPYSQAVRHGGLLFLSGQIPLDPETGAMVEGGIEAQARRALDNLVAVLAAAGCTTGDVVKTTIFLKSLGDFAKVNEVYGDYFSTHRPARATVEVSALPRGALVEIEAISVSREQ